MFPVLLQIEPIIIYSLWIFLGLGFFATLILIKKLSKYRRVKLQFLADNSLLIFFSGLVCSRLVFVIRNWQYFFQDFNLNKFFEIFYIWDKGLSPWGAVIGIFLCLYLLSKKEKADFVAWSDIGLTSLLFGMIFFDIGAFLDGRNYGNPTDLPWGVLIESSQYAIPIHPVQIYAAIYCAIIATVLLLIFNNESIKYEGTISLLAIFSYSFFRFIEEFLRGDEAFTLFFIREPQIYALLAMGISGYFLYHQYHRLKTPKED
jgi:phosphatidylglycerol---prolipoprotein diacylglyceryl transferase